MTGRVVHFEIPFDDGDRARAFYKEAFGWQLQSYPGMDYTLVTTGPTGDAGPAEPGFVNGGMLPRPESVAGTPVVVVDVESIDVALERIGELGGETVLGKQPVGDMGWSAYVRDPEGNVVGLWETAAGT
ncbi:VOC family protein [Geodermatophilus marinus]|uniref:VOC family protein n=1 Tax=Geodermatophilus sp. LHW52908 TaxID=2303986 RepID=UPI000E3E3FFD|nr:VOC family protein [Geodermatophilus sp. LHW52908]RFU21366.1 VOC family protein [Geodermatophilus sp. LHW52908]